MDYKCFNVSVEDHIAHIVMCRPEKRNSMNADFWRELPEIIRGLDRGGEARVIVISSTGPHFSAGLDLASFEGLGQGNQADERSRRIQAGAALYDTVLTTQESFNCLEEARIPILVCIQGGAIGGGVDLAVACDIRYATEDAFLTIQETNIGMTADVGTFPRLVKLIPEGFVREMAYTGRRVPAREAKEMGLINEVYPDHETMLASVIETAGEIASKAPLAIAGCKRMINYARDHSTADGLDYIAIWNASMLKVEEIQEALAANSEDRAGNFVPLPPKGRSA